MEVFGDKNKVNKCITQVSSSLGVSRKKVEKTIRLNSTLFLAESNKTDIKNSLTKGAWIDIKDSEENTPLIVSVKRKRTPIANELLEQGANVMITNNKGLDVLDYADTGEQRMRIEEKYIEGLIQKIKRAEKLITPTDSTELILSDVVFVDETEFKDEKMIFEAALKKLSSILDTNITSTDDDGALFAMNYRLSNVITKYQRKPYKYLYDKPGEVSQDYFLLHVIFSAIRKDKNYSTDNSLIDYATAIFELIASIKKILSVNADRLFPGYMMVIILFAREFSQNKDYAEYISIASDALSRIRRTHPLNFSFRWEIPYKELFSKKVPADVKRYYVTRGVDIDDRKPPDRYPFYNFAKYGEFDTDSPQRNYIENIRLLGGTIKPMMEKIHLTINSKDMSCNYLCKLFKDIMTILLRPRSGFILFKVVNLYAIYNEVTRSLETVKKLLKTHQNVSDFIPAVKTQIEKGESMHFTFYCFAFSRDEASYFSSDCADLNKSVFDTMIGTMLEITSVLRKKGVPTSDIPLRADTRLNDYWSMRLEYLTKGARVRSPAEADEYRLSTNPRNRDKLQEAKGALKTRGTFRYFYDMVATSF